MFSPIFNPRGVKVFGTVHKSSEHAYQYVKDVRDGYIPRAHRFDQRIQYLQQNKSGENISSIVWKKRKKLLLIELSAFTNFI